jgi:hypothetical protein
MYDRPYQLPPAFEKRYSRILDGKEELNSVAKLKDFWLFAIKQGWRHRAAREDIAQATFMVSCSDPNLNMHIYYAASDLRFVLGEWETYICVAKSPYPEKETDEQYQDSMWRILEFEVQKVASL